MDDEWVVVRNCNWLHEAHVIKSVLKADGITARIPDEHAHGVQPGIGAVRVSVRSIDVERAIDVLNSVADRLPR